MVAQPNDTQRGQPCLEGVLTIIELVSATGVPETFAFRTSTAL
jgi:hypothetical protein